MATDQPRSVCGLPLEWHDAASIFAYPSLHSSPMVVVPVLVAVQGWESPRIGWWIADADRWYVEGSPSEHVIVRFMPLPSVHGASNG